MKKFTSTLIIALVISTIGFTSCKPDSEPSGGAVSSVSLKLILKDDNATLRQGETINLENNQDIIVSLFRLFLSNITLKSSNEQLIELNKVALLSPGIEGENSFTMDLADGDYSTLTFGLGVDAAMNDSDPSDYANDHPLSIYSSMYWSMLKYRFAKFEAKVNTSGNLGSQSDIAVAYHPGTDPLYKIVELPVNLTVSNGNSSQITLAIDMNKLLAGNNAFDFSKEAQSHSSPGDIEIADKFMDNLQSAISVEVGNN